MHRHTLAFVAATILALGLMGLAGAAIMAMPAGPESDAPQATALEIFMSDQTDGARQRTFLSNTHRIFAVVSYEDAANEQYHVRLRDLSGIEVYRSPVTLSGTGTQSREITVSDFVGSYEAAIASQSTTLSDSMADLASYCANPPPAPSPWPPQPPPNPTPGPTPTPSGFLRWQSLMLDSLESSNTVIAELVRTLRAVGAMPDVQASSVIQDNVTTSVDQLLDASSKLTRAERTVNPPSGSGPGTPTPDPPTAPDSAAACALVGEADDSVVLALAAADTAIAGIPEDTSGWRLPPTSSRYDDGQFASCLQYDTDLVDVSRGTSVDVTSWTVGDPGEPALMFPGPDLVDRSNLGRMGVSPRELFASSVQVPDVIRTATVNAFVTDEHCIPLDGITVTFGVDPSTAGSVMPRVATIQQGVAQTQLTSGFSATLGSEVTGVVCVDDCPEPVTGRGTFTVVGPPATLFFFINRDTINPMLGERANISVRAVDANGRNVADGSQITVSIAGGDPGVLARDIKPLAAPTPQPELLGKSATLFTLNGFSNVPPGDDPGLIYEPDLYLMAGTDGEGPVELMAEASNGVEAPPKLVFIESQLLIYMPLALHAFDVKATPPFVDPENPPPTVTPSP